MIQDGRLITARDCSSQSKRRGLEDATLSDKFWSLMEQKIPSGGNTRVTSATLMAGAAVPPAPRQGSSQSRVNRAGSPSDRGLEPREGRVAYYRHKKEARQENPGQKSTISFNTADLALGNNNLDAHSRDLI